MKRVNICALCKKELSKGMKKMKKFFALVIALCLLLTAVPVTMGVSAAGETTYAQGDLVWSQDFEGLAADTNFKANPTNGITFPLNEGNAGSAVIKEDAATGNKYLHMSSYVANGAASQTRLRMLVPAGDAIDENGVFTFDVDIKIDAYDAETMAGTGGKYTEYDTGLSSLDDTGKLTGNSYMTIGPKSNEAYTGSTAGLAINGARNSDNVAKQAIPGDTTLTAGTANFVPHAWNTYRFISRYDAEKQSWYADTYLNGMHFYVIGQRSSKDQHDVFMFTISLTSDVKAGGASLDNMKAYYGATPVSEDETVTKGKFNIDTFDFNDTTSGTLTTGTANQEKFYGENYDHTSGVLQRYNTFSLTVESVGGKAGKKAADKAVSVTAAGKFMIQRQNTTSGISNTQNSTKLCTWVPEGDSVEFATEVLFKDINDQLLFYLARSDGHRCGAAIEVTPALWSTGTFSDYGSTYDSTITNNRQPINTKLPLNKWIKMRVVLTRGTGTGANKLSIYADNIPICESVEPKWDPRDYNGTNITYNASDFNKGIAGIHIIGTVDIDNFEINKYLCGESFATNTAEPLITADKNVSKTMSRGKIYANGQTINDILTEFKLVGEELDPAVKSFTVRDVNGTDVSDYTQPAEGKYIDLLTIEDEHLYVNLVANNEVTSISEPTDGKLNGFSEINVEVTTDDEGNPKTTESAVEAGSEQITVTPSAKGFGRASTDNSIVLNNPTETKRRLSYALNSYEDVVYEFSFLADKDTDFSVGYDVGYVLLSEEKWPTTNKTEGSGRAYKEMLTIADNKVTGEANSTVDCGTYKNNEWTRVKIYLNHLNTEGKTFSAYISINDGKYKWVSCGPNAYPLVFKNLYINLPAGKTVVLDDIEIIEGVTALSEMPLIQDYSGEDGTVLSRGKLTAPAYSGLRKYELDGVLEELTAEPAEATVRVIKSDGAEVSSNDVVEKIVVNDGRLYRYYSVDAAYFAEEIEDGTRYITFRLYGVDPTVLEKSAFIAGVYEKSTGQMKDLMFVPVDTNPESGNVTDAPDNKSKMIELEFTPSSAVYNSETDEIRYFLWNMDTINPLGASMTSNI